MPHYYSEKQTSELNLTKVTLRICGEELVMFSGSGVFSKKRLDKGTELLLKEMIISNGQKVLDLGCGMGVVGIYAKKKHPDIELMLADVSERAIKLTKESLKLHDMKARMKRSDGFAKIKETDFDTILLNPPQVAGKETCFRLLKESSEHLIKGGSLQIVARHNKGGKTYSEKMKNIFGNMKEIAIGSGYRIYMSIKE